VLRARVLQSWMRSVARGLHTRKRCRRRLQGREAVQSQEADERLFVAFEEVRYRERTRLKARDTHREVQHRKQQDAAAVRIQAVHRGRQGRERAADMKARAAASPPRGEIVRGLTSREERRRMAVRMEETAERQFVSLSVEESAAAMPKRTRLIMVLPAHVGERVTAGEVRLRHALETAEQSQRDRIQQRINVQSSIWARSTPLLASRALHQQQFVSAMETRNRRDLQEEQDHAWAELRMMAASRGLAIPRRPPPKREDPPPRRRRDLPEVRSAGRRASADADELELEGRQVELEKRSVTREEAAARKQVNWDQEDSRRLLIVRQRMNRETLDLFSSGTPTQLRTRAPLSPLRDFGTTGAHGRRPSSGGKAVERVERADSAPLVRGSVLSPVSIAPPHRSASVLSQTHPAPQHSDRAGALPPLASTAPRRGAPRGKDECRPAPVPGRQAPPLVPESFVQQQGR